ncbi:MAG: glucose-6-phosphate isomerase, partial [Caldilinea sp.]
MTHPLDRPFSFAITPPSLLLEHYDNHLTRRLASMAGYYLDPEAYTAQLAQENSLVYEVYEIHRPEQVGELLSGLSIL